MENEKDNSKINTLDLAAAGLVPMLVGKIAILYFGTQYSAYPGEGWGYWLIGTICFTITMAARFLWKYRNWKD